MIPPLVETEFPLPLKLLRNLGRCQVGRFNLHKWCLFNCYRIQSRENPFKVGVAPETLRRTNLGDLKHGAPVNLERAVTSEVRLGGHIVQGHVDTIAKIVDKKPDGNAIAYTFELRDKEFINYIVHKGFIAIDGASLTVTNVDPSKVQFSIMLISYSQEKVILAKKEVGDTVNIEVDLTGKFIENKLR